MIRDRLILGINDKHIQARLIREPEITKSIALSKENLKTLNPEGEMVPPYTEKRAAIQGLGYFAKACYKNKNKEDPHNIGQTNEIQETISQTPEQEKSKNIGRTEAE
ncbi:hypothetical protein JTB14_013312 [Gonioctena quinquepunctata]|nr:hypothetical protein JTB14_013312 [Gonioctena quinquepunctata]